jgi:HK97 family phage prohead protease
MKMKKEIRNFSDCKIRTINSEDGYNIEGLASPYNKRSLNLGYYMDVYEVIKPGAFEKALQNSPTETVALFNHDPNYVLGSLRAKTLRLEETKDGLLAMINAPSSGTIKDLVVDPVERGDITGMSIAFSDIKQETREVQDGEIEYLLVEIYEIRELHDVSIVTYPAYPDTDVHLKSHESAKRYFENIEQEKERYEYMLNFSKSLNKKLIGS